MRKRNIKDSLLSATYIKESEFRPMHIEGVSTSTAGFVGITDKGGENNEYKDKTVFISSWEDFVSKFGHFTSNAPYMAPAVFSFFANGGTRCYVVSVDIGADLRKGLQALSEVDDVSIVVFPGITDSTVQRAMIRHCETLKDRFCIFDSAKGEDLEALQRRRNSLVSDKGYGALYYPWIEMEIEKEDFDGKVIYESMLVPPSGAIAGVYARCDTKKGVYKVPANEVLHGAIKLEYNITKNEQDVLNITGINCIRSFYQRGILVWGARTIASDHVWKYISVRRLLIYLEESISKATKWVVFEPNDEVLWTKVSQMVSDFLFLLWRDGALMGTTADKAYFVKCDRETMTQNDINNGILKVVIGVAAVRPAEFIVFNVTQYRVDSNNKKIRR